MHPQYIDQLNHYGNLASAAIAEPKAPIESAMDELSHRVDSLQKTLDSLVARLAPVSLDRRIGEEPQKVCGTTLPSAICVMEQRIRSAMDRIDRMADQIGVARESLCI